MRFFLVSSFINDDPCPVDGFSEYGVFEFFINNQIDLPPEYFLKLLLQLEISIEKIDIFARIENDQNIDVAGLRKTLS